MCKLFLYISTLFFTAQMGRSLMNMHELPKLSVVRLTVVTPSRLALGIFLFLSLPLSGIHSVKSPRRRQCDITHESTAWMMFTKKTQRKDESLYDIVQKSKDRLKIASVKMQQLQFSLTASLPVYYVLPLNPHTSVFIIQDHTILLNTIYTCVIQIQIDLYRNVNY